MLDRGDHFLVLRYSNGIYDCIKNHRAVLDDYGYCWFGKIGVAPSEETMKAKLNPERPLVALYCQGDVFICKLLDVSFEKPSVGYPAYYQRFLYNRNIQPKMYFKLGSIEELPKDIFAKCVSLSSRRLLVETIPKSMASMFYGEYPINDSIVSEAPAPQKPPKLSKKDRDKKEEKIVDKYSCVYQKNGICTNKRCISYEYECERPISCLKQKPRIIEKE